MRVTHSRYETRFSFRTGLTPASTSKECRTAPLGAHSQLKVAQDPRTSHLVLVTSAFVSPYVDQEFVFLHPLIALLSFSQRIGKGSMAVPPVSFYCYLPSRIVTINYNHTAANQRRRERDPDRRWVHDVYCLPPISISQREGVLPYSSIGADFLSYAAVRESDICAPRLIPPLTSDSEPNTQNNHFVGRYFLSNACSSTRKRGLF